MERIFSTYRYVAQPLSPTILTAIQESGIKKLEVFCSGAHFDYSSPEAIKELSGWLEERGMELHSMHSPTQRDTAGRHESGTPISISDGERVRRLDAVDEVKRAIDVAERIPFKYLVQHMGSSRQSNDPRFIDAAFNSLEHLAIFAKQRGVTIALENTPSELGAPLTLQNFIKETHLNDLRFCFDTGHANIEGGIPAAFESMREKVVTTHVHDNDGEDDEHLMPYEGKIDWAATLQLFAEAPHALPIVLELKEHATPSDVLGKARATFDRIENELESKRTSQTQS
jgi:sugar phosphate isomerase/epimerase